MGEEGYSFSLTTFSPSGKLLQIEHALKAVSSGKTSLGIQGGQAAGTHELGPKFVQGQTRSSRPLQQL